MVGNGLTDSYKIDIPIVLFVFRRLDTVKLIYEKLRQVKPSTLYVFADGARSGRNEEAVSVRKVQEYVKGAVDWECRFYLECAEKNRGCASNICHGIDTVFKKEDAAIILEDDAVPLTEFFIYCQQLLVKYREDMRIQYIAGFNAVGDCDVIQDSYAFSMSAPMSGAIATWSDRWNSCDFRMRNWPDNKKNKTFLPYYYYRELYRFQSKAFDDSYRQINDGWDYQFLHDQLDKKRYAVVPKGNLATSYGYTEGAFHPQNRTEAYHLSKIMNATILPCEFPLREPDKIDLNREYDRLRQKLLLGVKGGYVRRHLYYMGRHIKDAAYRFLPESIWKLIKKIVVER